MKTIGVDVGGTKILCRLVDTDTGKARGRSKCSTPKTGPEDVLKAVVDLIHELDPANEAEAVGIGFPGYVRADGVVVHCTNIVGWDRPLDVSARLGAILGKTVVVGNDVSVGALAEYRLGKSMDSASSTVDAGDDLLAVFVGTGVGGGLILGGKIRSGGRGLAGEIGHVTVVPGGELCGCGELGHLEAYAGKAGMERRARSMAGRGQASQLVDTMQEGSLKSRQLLAAFKADDPVTIQLLSEAADALALAIGNVSAVLDVPHVVLGGGVTSRLGQEFVDQIKSSDWFGGFGPESVELSLASRIDDAGSIGAGILAGDHLRARRE